MTTQRIALVTGGTRGIGLAIVQTLTDAGYRVATLYHGNDEAAKSCHAQTGAATYKVDVGDFAAVQTTCEQIAADLGPIDILVNNAGITRDAVLHKMTEAHWHDVMQTNLGSCFNTCRAVIGGMRERGFGRIVNISSINGQKGQFGQTNYAAAKAGMIGFTKSLALESAGKGITVNVIAPGYIATDMTAQMRPEVLESIVRQIPATRMGKPEEIAALILYLVSDAAAFMTGETLAINGGQYMS
ncbi:MAG: acetoacetyl-CoA reductase [Pseudomonadota bacterium]